MENLHKKFLTESTFKCSYSLFCTLRPYFVVKLTLQDRQTCLCKIHENLEFMADKLHSIGVLPHKDIKRLAESLNCETSETDEHCKLQKKCCYNECDTCKDALLEIQVQNPDQEVLYYQWKQMSKQYTKIEKGEHVTVDTKVTVKEKQTDTLEKQVNKFQEQLFQLWTEDPFRVWM